MKVPQAKAIAAAQSRPNPASLARAISISVRAYALVVVAMLRAKSYEAGTIAGTRIGLHSATASPLLSVVFHVFHEV